MNIFVDRQITIKKRLPKKALIKIACDEWGTFIWLDSNSITSMNIIEKKRGYNLIKYKFDGHENYVWLSNKELQDIRDLVLI